MRRQAAAGVDVVAGHTRRGESTRVTRPPFVGTRQRVGALVPATRAATHEAVRTTLGVPRAEDFFEE